MNKQPVSYYQTDRRWANKPYAVKGEASTIGGSGCGPTAMAMVLATWADKRVTPETECAWALAHGFKALRHGTYYAYFAPAARRYGLTCQQLNGASIYGSPNAAYHATVLAAVKAGDLVIACMGPGNWTRGGHFILLWDVDVQKDIAYVNDPASSLTRRTRGSWQLLKKQVKFYFRIKRPAAIQIPKEEFVMTEQEENARWEQFCKTHLKDYVRDVLQELAVKQAAETVEPWFVKDGTWDKGQALGITDGSRPRSPASRSEVVAMIMRTAEILQRQAEEARVKAEEMGMD